jgi:glycosyltransferase involved in cell wall biosynthesis
MPGPVRSISAIVPVYNEELQIATIIPALNDAFEARGADWEIVVVDNASTDGTQAELAGFLGPRVRVLRNEVNRGKGFSVRRGMLEATGELRLLCDADCTPSLRSLPELEALGEAFDVVAGARNDPDSQIARQQPVYRRAASLGFIFLCRRVMAEPLRDVFCGFKLFSGAAADEVFRRSQVDGWAFDVEALALARALGYAVAPCPIAWVHRPGSRLSIPRVVVPALSELIAARSSVRRHAALRPVPSDAVAPVGGGQRP